MRLTDIEGIWIHIRFLWHTRDNNWVMPAMFLLLSAAVFILLFWRVIAYNQTSREINCLALNVYHEARGESRSGQIAVAQVTLNRVASPLYPDTVCDAVYEQKWDYRRKRMVGAFSWTEFDDPEKPEGHAWLLAVKVAEDSFYNRSPDLVNGALFYHARYIRPRWARKKQAVARHGRHIFYR